MFSCRTICICFQRINLEPSKLRAIRRQLRAFAFRPRHVEALRIEARSGTYLMAHSPLPRRLSQVKTIQGWADRAYGLICLPDCGISVQARSRHGQPQRTHYFFIASTKFHRFFLHSYCNDTNQHTDGVADTVGHGDQAQILGGVVLFDRRRQRKSSDNISIPECLSFKNNCGSSSFIFG